MESYVERWKREQTQKAENEQKAQKGRKSRKAVKKDGTDTRSEGQADPAESNSGEETV